MSNKNERLKAIDILFRRIFDQLSILQNMLSSKQTKISRPDLNHVGEKNPKHKLTKEDVQVIKCLVKKGHSNGVIAELFNVGKQCIIDIKKLRNWKHLEIKEEYETTN